MPLPPLRARYGAKEGSPGPREGQELGPVPTSAALGEGFSKFSLLSPRISSTWGIRGERPGEGGIAGRILRAI